MDIKDTQPASSGPAQAVPVFTLEDTYSAEGIVVPGDRRGRQLGFPTANVAPDEGFLLPADGIYAGWLKISDESLPSAISVGPNVTFQSADRRLEVHVLDRADLSLYGMKVGVIFAARLRAIRYFNSPSELIAQMNRDVEQTRTILQATESAHLEKRNSARRPMITPAVDPVS